MGTRDRNPAMVGDSLSDHSGPSSEVVGKQDLAGWRAVIAYRFPLRYRVSWFALLAVLLISAVTADDVFKPVSLQLVTALSGVLLIASLGQLFVVTTGGIDLSVPGMMVIAAAATEKVSEGANGHLAQGIIVALGLVVLFGALNGFLVAVLQLNALIVTLAMNTVILAVVTAWAGSVWTPVNQMPRNLINLTNKNLGPVNVLLIIALAAAAALAFIFSRTRIGRRYVAAGTNPRAARILGVRVRACQFTGFVVGAVLFGAAGILLGGFVKTPDASMGNPYLLITFVALALAGVSLQGGPSSVAGVAAAALVLPMIDQYLAIKGYAAGVQVLVQGLVIIAAVGFITGIARIRSIPALLRKGLHRS